MTRRVSKGTPAGGQFAPDQRGKNNIPTAADLPRQADIDPAPDVTPGRLPAGVRMHTEPDAIRFKDLQGRLHHPRQAAVIPIQPGKPKEWWKNGKKHRANGPAVEYPDGGYEWWHNGVMHRADGPAAHYSDGSQKWLRHGKRHRLDGPAIINTDGSTEWWVNGTKVTTQEDFHEAAKAFHRHHGSGMRAWMRRRKTARQRHKFPYVPMDTPSNDRPSGQTKPAKPENGGFLPS